MGKQLCGAWGGGGGEGACWSLGGHRRGGLGHLPAANPRRETQPFPSPKVAGETVSLPLIELGLSLGLVIPP